MKKRYKVLIVIALVLALLAGVFLYYVSDYYRADSAIEAIGQVENQFTVLSPDTPGTTGLIFYPGGKVEEKAYLPLLERLREEGITCVLVEMPFHLAVFDMNAADGAFELLPEIENWYIGGHSLGGAMASSYASSNKGRIEGLILLGAYIYGDFDPGNTLTIYGSNDQVMDRSKITYEENVVEIEGGNHAYFGNYGEQDGDGTAAITREEQQGITAEAISQFVYKEN